MSQLSAAEMKQLRALLAKAQLSDGSASGSDDGMMTMGTLPRRLMPRLSDDDEFEQVNFDIGAMSDASKRCMEESEAGYGGPGRGKKTDRTQLPVPPKTPTDPTLPPGVKSMTEWGSTIIDFGKMKDRQITYDELIKLIEAEKEVSSYHDWLQRCITDKCTGPSKDLVDYLHARGIDHRGGVTFPGSTQRRRMRSYAD